MNISEIKNAVDFGKKVHWSNVGYDVVKDNQRPNGQYFIVCAKNSDTIGLTNRAGDKLNGEESEFFLGE